MKKILLILALVFASSSWASTPAKIESVTIAGRVITDFSKLIILRCSSNSSANNYNGCRLNGSTSDYVVPGATTLRVIGVYAKDWGASDWCNGTIGYADAAPIADDTTTAPTPGRIELAGRLNVSTHAGQNNAPADTTGDGPTFENFTIPTGKYPFWHQFLGHCTVAIYGILE
jgi:hypothetical protein